jgi:predicted cupin superfamily sugar epimerase
MTREEIIQWLGLQPNVQEGGLFASTYTSSLRLDDAETPLFPPSGNARPLCSAIYYFLDTTTFSALHRVGGDMIYHFYAGDPVEMLLLHPGGGNNRSEVCRFSNRLSTGSQPMKIIPGGTWLGSKLVAGGAYALMGVTMAPGFHPVDYAIAKRQELLKQYPEQEKLILELTNKDQP